MKISEVRKQLSDLVDNLPKEGIPVEKHGKIIARLVPYVEPTSVPIEHAMGKLQNFRDQAGRHNLEAIQAADKARRDILSKVNRKSR